MVNCIIIIIIFHAINFDDITPLRTHKRYLQRLELRYFVCSSLIASSFQKPIKTNDKIVSHQNSVIIDLIDIRSYLEQFWEVNKWTINSVSTRISVIVRIVAKSLLYDNLVYITDNSLLSMQITNNNSNINAIPLIIDDMETFSGILQLKSVDNQSLYIHQPLVIIRDIAMYFQHHGQNSSRHLTFRFDEFSIIDGIHDIGIQSDQIKCSFDNEKGENMIKPSKLLSTPWTSLNTTICKLVGNVDAVSINNAFNQKCNECQMVNKRNNFQNEEQQSMELDEEQDDEDIACIDCFKKNAEIRFIINEENRGYYVVMIPVGNIWYKSTTNNDIKNVISQLNDEMYIDQLQELKKRLNNLVDDKGDDDEEELKLKQCIIEYKVRNNNNNNDSVDNVECVYCFHCVI